MVARAAIAKEVTRALSSVAVQVLDGKLGAGLREELLAELAPQERAFVESQYRTLDRLATVRVDMMIDPSGVDRILEVNTTIPAMQGYSDIAARAFVEVALEEFTHLPTGAAGREAEAILSLNGSNADDLLASLLACGGKVGPEGVAIALLHRPGDSQLGELGYLANRFRSVGADARTVSTDELRLVDGEVQWAEGFRPGLIYRHVFAQRAAPGSALARLLADPRRHRLFNPVAPHLEQKSMLSCLSAIGADETLSEAFGLDEATRRLLSLHLPWTRRLVPGAGTLPGGEETADLLHWVGEHPDTLVIKKSWDFGGKGVFFGSKRDEDGHRARVRSRFGSELDWTGLVAACVAEGGWVAQERIPMESRRLSIATAEGATDVDAFVDVSAYTNLGVEASPSGGVCRASLSPIVNIQSGGGVVPLLSHEAMARLEACLSASSSQTG